MMRWLVAILLIGALVGTRPALAQVTGETVLLDGTSIFYPGGTGSKCFDLGAGLLKVQASSPPGRTGESAYLDVAPDAADAHPLLSTLVADSFAAGAAERPIDVQYPIDAGHFCVTVSVTHRLSDANTDPAARPTKQIWLHVTWSAS